MQGNDFDTARLNANEIAGAKTANPMIDWIGAFRSISPYLAQSPNAYGGVDLDFNFALVANSILSLVSTIAADFRAAISGTSLTVAGGNILLPGETHSIPQYTRNLTNADDGNSLCLVATSPSSWGYEWRLSVPPIVSGYTVRLPVCTVALVGGSWRVFQHHLGSFIFPFPPAPLIAAYDTSKRQALTHASGELEWAKYCGDCSDSSSSISTSSSSGSSSTSTSASVSSSSGGGAWTGGYLLVTDDGMCNGQWAGNGSYYLTSGDPHNTSGVWTCAGVGVISYKTIGGSLGWWIQAGGKNAIIHGDGGSGGDPTTWVDGTTWKGEVENEEHSVICYAPVTFIATQSVEDDLI